jgi:Leucine-rich repeat (LRR) protein
MGLTSVSAELGLLTNLTEVSLGGNRLTSIPACIEHLAKLRHLWIHSNELTSLPPQIGKLSSLQRCSALPKSVYQKNVV